MLPSPRSQRQAAIIPSASLDSDTSEKTVVASPLEGDIRPDAVGGELRTLMSIWQTMAPPWAGFRVSVTV